MRSTGICIKKCKHSLDVFLSFFETNNVLEILHLLLLTPISKKYAISGNFHQPKIHIKPRQEPYFQSTNFPTHQKPSLFQTVFELFLMFNIATVCNAAIHKYLFVSELVDQSSYNFSKLQVNTLMIFLQFLWPLLATLLSLKTPIQPVWAVEESKTVGFCVLF